MFKQPLAKKWKMQLVSRRRSQCFVLFFFFHEGVNPGELLVEMNNGDENTTGIKAADGYLFTFFFLSTLEVQKFTK